MTDEELARQVLGRLFPRGTWARGARETRIPERTFARICSGDTIIKPENWERLRAYPPFVAEFSAAKKQDEPSIDRRTREVMGRLGVALGPRVLSLIAIELEALSRIMEPEKVLAAIERVTETARDAVDSKAESDHRQKIQ